MDYLRWILLAVGLLFIGVVYVISRRRGQKRDEYSNSTEEDLPEISTHWDDLDEAVGEVRIIARQDEDDDFGFDEAPGTAPVDEPPAESWREGGGFGDVDSAETRVSDTDPELEPEPEPDESAHAESTAQPRSTEEVPEETVLVLNILAREPSTFSGASINSIATANRLQFGEFNIYHRMDENGKSLFSLVNMLKPGSFDPDTMHDMKTTGIALFMQLPGPERPLEAFDEMLQTAHRIAEMLEGRLCDGRRQPLTESEADRYRRTVAAFDER